MFTGWFYVCAGWVISWFLSWEQGAESLNLSVPTSKTPVQRLILEINKSRFWGFYVYWTAEKRNKPYWGGVLQCFTQPLTPDRTALCSADSGVICRATPTHVTKPVLP